MQSETLAMHIQRQLEEQADIHILVAQDIDAIVLSGKVGSEEEGRIAEDIAASIAPDKHIENYLDVESTLRVGSEGNTNLLLDEVEGDEIPESIGEFRREGLEFEPGVNNQPLETDAF